MTNKTHVLNNLNLGDAILFPDDENEYVVRHFDLRYVFAGSDCGYFYTIIDKWEETFENPVVYDEY